MVPRIPYVSVQVALKPKYKDKGGEIIFLLKTGEVEEVFSQYQVYANTKN